MSRTLLLLKYILDGSPDLRPAARLLAEAHDTNPAAVNELLISPWVSLWAAVCARDLSQRRHRLAANALALAAAARCGLRGRAMVLEPHEGRIMIPSLGMLARGGPGRLTVEDLDGPWWWPVRSLTSVYSGRRITVPLDDLDPYRGFHGAAVQSRLTATQFDIAAANFAEAWRLLVERCPRRAAELAGGMMSIAPLAGGDAISATSPEAFGGLATTIPGDWVEFAVVMVRELQHSKLSALAALAPLSRSRPVFAMLHRIYALTAVATVWRALIGAEAPHAPATAGQREGGERAADSQRQPQAVAGVGQREDGERAKGSQRQRQAVAGAGVMGSQRQPQAVAPEGLRIRATSEFAFARAQLGRALDGLAPAEPGLTAAGRRLVARIDQTVKSLARVNIPKWAETNAQDRLAAAA